MEAGRALFCFRMCPPLAKIVESAMIGRMIA
jgi:hypothetical protein